MRTPKNRTRVTLAAMATISLLCGCAVLKIDVDVYKGPMANHRDVQAEQLAALAMAAKPLLIDLRNQLDGITVERDGKVTFTDNSGDDHKTNSGNNPKFSYKNDFIPPPDYITDAKDPFFGYYQYGIHKQGEPEFTAEWLVRMQAVRVNEILSLYSNQYPDISDFVTQIERSASEYDTNYEIWDKNFKEMEAIVAKYQPIS